MKAWEIITLVIGGIFACVAFICCIYAIYLFYDYTKVEKRRKQIIDKTHELIDKDLKEKLITPNTSAKPNFNIIRVKKLKKAERNDLLARNQEYMLHEEINKLYREHKRLQHEIKCIKDPQYELKQHICIGLQDTLGDTIQVLNPNNLIDRLQYLKREIGIAESMVNPQPTTPEDQNPKKEIVKTTIKTVIDERFKKSFNDCMDALHKFGEAVKYACDKVIDETPTEQLENTPADKEANEEEIYHNLIKKYGKQQIIVAIEELSELQKELCKHLRDETNQKAIIEEVCDVQIMLDQIILYFGISALDLDTVKRWKLERTKERLLGNDKEN